VAADGEPAFHHDRPIDVDSEFQRFAVDPECAPEWVGSETVRISTLMSAATVGRPER
jgi:hypothetical protein